MYVFCMGKKESLKNTISSSVYWFKLQCVSLKERKSWYMIQSSSFIFIMRFNYFHYSIIIMSVVHLSVKKPGKIIIISSQETGFKFRWCSQHWRCNLDTVDLDDLHTKCFGVFLYVCSCCMQGSEKKCYFKLISRIGNGSQAGKWIVATRGQIVYALFHLKTPVPVAPSSCHTLKCNPRCWKAIPSRLTHEGSSIRPWGSL